MTAYYRTQAFRWRATFRDDTDALVTPTSVVFTAVNPLYERTDYTLGTDNAVDEISTGIVDFTVELDTAGPWMFDVKTSGNVSAPGRRHINVHPLYGDDATTTPPPP